MFATNQEILTMEATHYSILKIPIFNDNPLYHVTMGKKDGV